MITWLVLSLALAQARAQDGHDTFDPAFRDPPGAVSYDRKTVNLRLAAAGATRVRIRVWDAAIKRETWKELARVAGSQELWEVAYPVPKYPTILYYFFEADSPVAGGRTVAKYQICRDPKFHAGGKGVWSGTRDDLHSFRLTVYDPTFEVPEWLRGAVIYQIFPDRFRNGDPANDPPNRGGPPSECDPRQSRCRADGTGEFRGGDLKGVLDELPYIKSLGATAIYLNPIFTAGTYHRYDTQNYREIDPRLGDLALFDRLASSARASGIRLILDGVFNHTAADSPYFDLFGKYSDVGACESPASPYREWYFLPHIKNAAMRSTQSGRELVYCGGLTYEAWNGAYSLPKLNSRRPEVRELFFSKSDSVVPYWLGHGASGFRLDASGEVDRGSMDEPDNGFWSGVRGAIRAADPEAVMIGEEWGYATPWLLGRDFDSVMNYRFRSAVLSWLFDSCQGQGCAGGTTFSDGDSNDSSVLGAISVSSESTFLDQLASIEEDTPKPAFHAMMNVVGTHDTSRILWVLGKISSDSREIARRKLALLALFELTYPGAPAIYYGDEAGLSADDVWRGGTWVDDPYNRLSYPWKDQGGAGGDAAMLAHFSTLARLRAGSAALRHGEFEPVLVDDAHRSLVFLREADGRSGPERVWVAINRGLTASSIAFSSPKLGPEGSRYIDALTGERFLVRSGSLNIGAVAGLGGRVLLPN